MDTQELELAISAEEMCRACLAAVDRTQLKPIFCNEILDGRIVPFPSVLELVTGEQVVKHEKLPNNVCSECKGKLRELYLFVGMAKKSSKLMYEIFTVEPPKPLVDSKVPVTTNHAYVQTEPEPEPAPIVETNFTKPIKCSEMGTQVEMENFLRTTSETGCQTIEQFEVEKSILPDGVEQMANIDVTTTTTAMFAEDGESDDHVLMNESSIDSTLLTFGDDENEYEMILLGDEPNEAEYFTLRSVESEEKKQLILEASGPHQEPKILNHRLNQLPKDPTTSKSNRLSRKAKSVHCGYCNLTDRPALLAKHFNVHKETLESCLDATDYYRCSECFMVFIAQSQFVEHECRKVQPDEEVLYHADLQTHEEFYANGIDVCMPRLKTFKRIGKKYQCGRCIKFSCSSIETMRQHCLAHEADDEKITNIESLWKSNLLNEIHTCGICKGHFPDATYIRQHLYFHQESFICIFDCGMIFVSFLRMTRHFLNKHLQSEVKEETEANTSQLWKKEGKHSCKLCFKVLASAESLKNHQKNHSRQRKYVCTECKKCFGQRSDLNNHLRIHTDERPYACKLCDKKFRIKSHLRDHMFTHEEENKFECEVCHKMFKAKRILAEHVRLHTGEKPHKCQQCSKTFARRQHLILHQKIHLKSESPGPATKTKKASELYESS